MKIKYMANSLSILRIILALSLLFISVYGPFFIAIYLLCGLTDILDGWVARKLQIESTLGARLDSIGDFVLVLVILVLFIPLFTLPFFIIIWIIAIAIVRILSVLVNFYKYHTFAMIHTYGNKITGFLLFLLPLSLIIGVVLPSTIILCLIATLTAVEELLIAITSKELYLDKKSIFSLR